MVVDRHHSILSRHARRWSIADVIEPKSRSVAVSVDCYCMEPITELLLRAKQPVIFGIRKRSSRVEADVVEKALPCRIDATCSTDWIIGPPNLNRSTYRVSLAQKINRER
jgi:hypothetical protein